MASIKLDPTKSYRVNFRLLEATGPSAVSIRVGEKPVVTAPPPPDQPTCKPGTVKYLWNYQYGINTNPPGPDEDLSGPNRWVPVGRKNEVFSIRIPAVNKFTREHGAVVPPARIAIGTSGLPGRIIPSRGIIFVSECPGDFDTPLPGMSKEKCTGEIRNGYGSFTVITEKEGNVASAYSYAPKYTNADRDFYFNFKYTEAKQDDNLGVALVMYVNSSSGTGLGVSDQSGGGILRPDTGGTQPKSTYNYDPVGSNPTQTAYRQRVQMNVGQTTSIRLPATQVIESQTKYGISISVTSVAGVSTPDLAEMVLSPNSNDFTNIPLGNNAYNAKKTITVGYANLEARSASPFNNNQCRLDPNQVYYLNLRWTEAKPQSAVWVEFNYN